MNAILEEMEQKMNEEMDGKVEKINTVLMIALRSEALDDLKGIPDEQRKEFPLPDKTYKNEI